MKYLWLLCLITNSVFGQLKVEKARFRPFEISVSGNSELAKIVLNDLELSGVFKNTLAAIAEGTVKIDLLQEQIIVTANNKTFKYKAPVSRKLAHQISNDVYKFFTGESGFFNSQIVASNKNKQIILLDFDGENPRQITKNNSINILPVLSPDGKDILFTSYLNKNPDLFSIKTDGSNLKIFSNKSGINSGASFAPNGSQIALTLSHEGKSDIYLCDKNCQNCKRLTSGFSLNTSPSFSPDGKQIAFVSNRSGNPQIYTMQTDGLNIKRITFQGKYNQAPKWSPLGDLIVFTGRDERNIFDIFLANVNSSQITRVTQDQGSNDEASFAPNGRMIVFSSTRNGSRDLFVSNLEGSFQKQITQKSEYWTPNWGPAVKD
ncbi:MAG: translocation protein TolB [Myxococcaceae bacterium]